MRKYLVRFLPHLGCAFFFSMFINLLALAYILYLRLLFDKVMDSRSMETLFFLTAAVIGAYVVSGIMEVFRSKLLVRIGVKFDQIVAGRIFGSMLDQSVAAGGEKHTQGLKDLNSIRNFLCGTGIFALFDTPWVPVYLAVIFLFHPLLGYLACAGALLLFLLVVVQEISTSRMQASHSQSAMNTDQFLSSSMRNAQTVYAMGMFPSMSRQWKQYNNQDVYYEDVLAARNGFFQSMAKFIMMGTVVVIMSTGAYLVIIHEATLGTMVASAMFMSRALSPIMMLGNAWRSFVDARLAYNRLNELMAEVHTHDDPQLPEQDSPEKPETCRAEGISLHLAQMPVFQDISFRLSAGEMMAVTGPSGSGKTSLARVLLGVWKPDQGSVFLDDISLQSFDQALLGRKMGYVPQEVELFSGTVAENIARLGEVDSPSVVDAAMQARAHDMILGLPQGYDTRVGEGGIALSGGQKQRIVLARALYKDPWLLVLDEPDSHLDQGGRESMKEVLADLKSKGVFLILISHNNELIKLADNVLDMQQGSMRRIE
ncbi:type I secretion system permease/ATPase [Desulfonatronospira sp. MSAO_Bac3]|uniref:type I secretion system permease/ATPase n=1 Tax=Desulfonatronospira sp. MSAO_Bac3 TaxID=2293857 RepID=UPI000FEDD48E|nr:type I secretion system permease/ATPase [Desulfonatronospira sp. MSAO_Bac3]RQD73034.1 MAG: type I secretion system permease/ATPase [Desulfonatronospira sp. MSAO_Bac3]